MKYEKEVKEFLQKQAHVKLAYLFGSVALQKAGKLSDIDIGIFLDESLEKKEKFKIKLKLISDLENILKNNRIDLVIMNDASISLNFEIIKANYPLFIQNKNLKVDLEQYIISRSLDRQYYDKRWADSLIKKTAK
ncbi:type VII toxin-antitoxin system MntA family adenylyltransferase antitoxin [Methanobacterium arcticum]|uniref:type VII toxin-antitoxin system MntA family adenylyltransferase antitoxin n=1 Tax=Methanobacterium arcticum TaxID=386456 RepID=UPI00064FFD1E|nr:nucleotidyltransferase domain-containing protein [Methanobacterium arcticum]